MGLSGLLDLILKKDFPLGKDKKISFVLPRYVEGMEEVEDVDLEEGNFVRLRGYKGVFKIKISSDCYNLYDILLVRENPPEGYRGRIPQINNFYNLS